MTPLTVVAVLHTALTPLVNHVFMFQLKLGMVGAAVAYNVLQVGADAWIARAGGGGGRGGAGAWRWRSD